MLKECKQSKLEEGRPGNKVSTHAHTHTHTHTHTHAHTHSTHTHKVVEAGADFKGADPLCGADKRCLLLVPHLYQSPLDLTMGGRRLLCVALEHKPRPQCLQRAVGTAPTLNQSEKVANEGVELLLS